MMKSTTDRDGATQSATGGILHTFVKFVRDKYGPIAVDDESVTLLGEEVHNLLPVERRDNLEVLIGLLNN